MRPARILGAVVFTLFVAFQVYEATATDIVYFTGKWCGACQEMKPVIAELEESGYDVRVVDVDREPELAEKYGIESLPSILVVRGGKIIDKIVGLTGVDRIVAALDRGGERLSKRLGGEAPGVLRKLLKAPTHFRDATVRVFGASGEILFGTEDSALIGTAYHVVRGEATTSIDITTASGQHFRGTLAKRKDGGPAIDPEGDVALIVASVPSERFCLLASDPPKPGAKLWIGGYPRGGEWRAISGTLGVCPGCGESHGGNTMTITGCNAIPGDSGGPIVDESGRIVGILSGSNWANPTGAKYSVCASLSAVHELCKATDYPFPFLPWRRHVEGELEEIQAVLPAAGQLPSAPDVGYLSAAVEARVGRLEAKIATLEADLATLKAGQDKILEIAEAAKQAAAASGSDFGKAFGERLDKIEKKNGDEYEKALAQAAAAKAAADAAKTQADGAVAAVEKDRETLRERVGQWVSQLPLVRQVGQLWTWAKWMTGGSIGMTVLICGVLFVLWRRIVKPDLRDFVESGGTNPTYLRQGTEAVTDVIPGTWDDKIGNAINNAFERFLRANPSLFGATPPAAPAPEAPK